MRENNPQKHFTSIVEEHLPSPYEKMVYALLQAGANPCMAHLSPKQFSKPNAHILKMMSAASADNEEREIIYDGSLQELVRGCIRKHLTKIHPEQNLYFTVQQLGLPPMLQSYLLFYTLQIAHTNLRTDEKELLLKTSAGDIESVRNLIQAGVDLNVQNNKGMTALIIACEAGCVELTEELIKAGANLNIRSLPSNTALMHALTENKTDCVMKLVKAGAKLNIQGSNGETALIKALRHNRKDSFEGLLESGADPNILSNTNVTPLIFAVISNMLDCTEKLIKAGADVNLTDNESPVIIFALGTEKCTKALIEAGANLNSRDARFGMTPLVASVEFEHIECTKQLIQAGADLNITHKRGTSPLMHAAILSKETWFTTLLKAGAEVDTKFIASFKTLKGN